MKRILLLVSLLGFLSFLMATPGPDHKVFWCHYPPGQWTGIPGTASHVLILSIDVAAQPGGAEGVSVDGTAATCPGNITATCAAFVVGGGCNPPCASGNEALCALCCA